MFIVNSVRRLRIPFFLLLGGLFFSTNCFVLAKVPVEGESPEKKLCELAATGELSDELVSQFYRYALKNAKEKIPASEEFWLWLARNKEIEQGLLVGLHPNYNPGVVKRLQELKDTFGTQVEQYPHLALAFAFVFGAAKDKSIKSPWVHWTVKDRPVPTCCESFAYYVKNKDKMLFPIDRLPWPLMIYVADNDIPLSERQWVLSKYGNLTMNKLGGLHTAPPYVSRTHAHSLPTILNEGGVCYKQAYYASRVMKSLGVPSVKMHVREHVYEGWITEKDKLYAHVGAAYGYGNGVFFCPLTRTKPKQYEFQFIVSAMNHSYDKYLKSKIASYVFALLPDETKIESLRLIEAGVHINPYVIDAWREYIELYTKGVLSPEDGWRMYQKAEKMIPEYPEVRCMVLNLITKSQLQNPAVCSEEQYKKTRQRFTETIKMLESSNRFDLALAVLKIHANYLNKNEGIEVLVDQALTWFKLRKLILRDENKLFTHVRVIAAKSKNTEALEKLIVTEYHRRKEVLKTCREKYTEYCDSFAHVTKAYSSYLAKKGDPIKAAELSVELDRYNRINGNLNKNNVREIIQEGRSIGAVGALVSVIKPVTQGSMVWRVLSPVPQGMKIRVHLQHAAAGKEGAFYLTAWSDNDRNGVPDTKVAVSPLFTAQKKDDWSEWQFTPTGGVVFVGFATKSKTPLYYQMGDELEGYYGLSNRVFYTRAFDGTPEQTVHPRFTNMKVEILRN